MTEVSIVMGSDSDLGIMSQAAEILEKLGVSYDITIASAHRTPELMQKYVKAAKEAGVKVIIAGAGGAAHLPGVIAALTDAVVIGVPIKTSTLSGVDSLYSIVQMPSGIPVATVAINGAQNAGILAAQILALANPELKSALTEFRKELKAAVERKADKLKNLGYRKYLEQM